MSRGTCSLMDITHFTLLHYILNICISPFRIFFLGKFSIFIFKKNQVKVQLYRRMKWVTFFWKNYGNIYSKFIEGGFRSKIFIRKIFWIFKTNLCTYCPSLSLIYLENEKSRNIVGPLESRPRLKIKVILWKEFYLQ